MIKILIIGAGEAGRMILREIRRNPDLGREVIGFLDDDSSLQGKKLESVPVIGLMEDLEDALSRVQADEAILAAPSAPASFVRRAVSVCARAKLPLRIVPRVREIITGDARYSHVREVEAEDLLGREIVDLDEGIVKEALSGKRILVTGAGGSIGGELCRQIALCEPAALFLLGRGENSIFDILDEVRTYSASAEVEPIIADIRDRSRLQRVFEKADPDVIYHAAAHKHVTFMEDAPDEAVKNNIGGTFHVVEAARASGVSRVVMLSTDKAANPRGVMGASKRVAEYLLRDLSGRDGYPSLLSVRFGNVLGSRGSVVPIFLRQIERGGPVTVSNRGARRFFMTLREAAMLVIQASVRGEGGEIYILEMGEAVEIEELARNLILLAGFEPDRDIEIVYTGLRQGEKLTEDLLSTSESTKPSFDPRVVRAQPELPPGIDILEEARHLVDLADRGDVEGILRRFEAVIPDYTRSAPVEGEATA